MVCDLDQNPRFFPGRSIMTIRNAIPERGLDKQKTFSIVIGEGLRTPVSVKTSHTFLVTITDGEGHIINFIDHALTVTMKRGTDIGDLALAIDSDVVGDETVHNLSFINPAPLLTDFIINIQVPPDCLPPMPPDFICKSEYPLNPELPCTISGQKITAIVEMDETLNGKITDGQLIKFSFSSIKNPTSMKPSQEYSVEIISDDYFEVAR